MLEDTPSVSHWHDNDYQLEPHRLQVREITRQPETEIDGGAPSADDVVPVLLGGDGVNKKKAPLRCSVSGCGKDLSREKDYYQRYRVCGEHLNLSALRCADGQEQRFCQQCGRFHPLGEFDGEKKSCRGKLREHNSRRRKRATAQQACSDPVELRPRRTKRNAATSLGQPDKDAGVAMPIKASKRKTVGGPFAHLLPGDRTTSSSSGAAARGSEHASVSSTRDGPREATSSQEGDRGSADLSNRQQAGSVNCQPSESQSSQGGSPELVVSTAMASPPADVQPSTRDDQENALEWLDPINGNAISRLQSSKSLIKDAVMQAMNKINLAKGHMQLPDIFSAFSQPPITQAPPRVSSLQALYAHLASAEPPQATASRLSQPTYPHLDNPQLPRTYFDNGSAQASSLGEPEFSSALASLSGAAHARQHLQLPHLEQSTQAQELLHHLEAQETLDWQRYFPNRPESVARPLLSPLANPVEYDDGQRLGSAQHDDSMLLALSMMLDGTTSPAPSGGPSPPRPDALLQHTFAGDRTPPPAAVLPLSGTQALSSPIHHMQRAQRQQQLSSMSLEQSLAMFQDKPSHHSNDIHLAAAPTCAQRDFSTVRQQPFPDRLYHQQHYRLNQDRGHLQSHLPHATPMPLSVTQELGPQGLMAAGHMLSISQQQQPQPLAAGRYGDNGSFSFLGSNGYGGRDVPGLNSMLLPLDKGTFPLPQDCNSSLWSNQGAPPQAMHQQHTGGMPGLPPPQAQGLAQGVRFPSMERQLLQERGLLDSSLYQAAQLPAPSGQAAVNELGQYVGRVNVKMLDHYPGSIPPYLMPHLAALTPEQQLSFVEGHMRSGCVHLVVDVMCTSSPSLWDVAAAVYRLMAFDVFWQQGAFFMQLPCGAAHWRNGRIMRLWTAHEMHAAMPQLLLGTAENAVLPCVVSGQAARLKLQGRKPRAATQAQGRIHDGAAKVLGRFLGKFVVNPDLLECPTCSLGSTEVPLSRNPGEVVVPGLAGVGVLTLEAEHAGLLSAAQPVVVARDAATQQDVCKLVARLFAARQSRASVNYLLVDIGMVLQYHDYLLKADDSSESVGLNDITVEWESAWADSALFDTQDSDGSEGPGSDNSTHCGVLSAAASAAAHSNAGSMTYMSDDDTMSEAEQGAHARAQHAVGSPSNGVMEGLWGSGSGALRGPAQLAPFTHPVYVAHMVRRAKFLVRLCRQEDLPALLEQVEAVASGMPQASAQHSGQGSQNASASETQHTDTPAQPAATRFVLPTILESSMGSGSSRAASEAGRNGPQSPNGSSDPSELGFDLIELPDIVESGPSTGESSQSAISSQTTDASGRTVITVVVPEAVRVLKDSAKEVHGDAGGKSAKDASGDTRPAEGSAVIRNSVTRIMTDVAECVAQRIEPYVPARVHQLVSPSAIIALVCLMTLASLLLLGYLLREVTTASPVLTWTILTSLLMISLLRLMGASHVGSRLELVFSLNPMTMRAYSTVLPYWSLLRDAWLQACSGQHERRDLIQSCAASCLSLAMVLMTSRQQAATWPNNLLLPGQVILSVAPASAWAVDRGWYLAQRHTISLAIRGCMLVLVCIALTGGLWVLPWLLLTLLHPSEGTVQHQLLAMTESLVVIGQAVSGMLGHAAWSYGSLQGVLLFTLAAHKLTHLLRHVLVQSLEHIPLPC